MGEERLCARLSAGILTLFLVLPLPNSVTSDKSPHLSESLSSSSQLDSWLFCIWQSMLFMQESQALGQRRNELDSEVLPLAWPWGPLATCKHTLKFLEGRYQNISLTVAGLDGAPGRLGSRRFSGIKIIMNLCHVHYFWKNQIQIQIYMVFSSFTKQFNLKVFALMGSYWVTGPMKQQM